MKVSSLLEIEGVWVAQAGVQQSLEGCWLCPEQQQRKNGDSERNLRTLNKAGDRDRVGGVGKLAVRKKRGRRGGKGVGGVVLCVGSRGGERGGIVGVVVLRGCRGGGGGGGGGQLRRRKKVSAVSAQSLVARGGGGGGGGGKRGGGRVVFLCWGRYLCTHNQGKVGHQWEEWSCARKVPGSLPQEMKELVGALVQRCGVS